MESIIFEYIDDEGNECVSIGNMAFLQETMRNCYEVINVLQRNHSEEDWERFCDMSQEEIYSLLQWAIQKNMLHVLYLN